MVPCTRDKDDDVARPEGVLEQSLRHHGSYSNLWPPNKVSLQLKPLIAFSAFEDSNTESFPEMSKL